MAGIPEGVVDGFGSYAPTDPLWLPVFNRFVTFMLPGAGGGGMNFRIRTQTPQPILPQFTITILPNLKAIRLTWPTALPAGVIPGATIKLTGEHGEDFVNGLWKIQFTNPAAFTADLKAKKRTIYGVPLNDGAARIIIFGDVPVTTMVARKGSRKPLGRPSDLYHGKSVVRT